MKNMLLLYLIFLMGCATPYQKEGYSGGYSDLKLNKDIYQVSFKGNGFTSNGSVSESFLRRCAELTIEHGYEFFIFLDQEARSASQNLGTNYSGTIARNYAGQFDYSGTSYSNTITRHEKSGVVKLFKSGNRPETAYSAKEILTNMGLGVSFKEGY